MAERRKITDKIKEIDKDAEKQRNKQSGHVPMEYLGAQISRELGGRVRRAALTQKENAQRPCVIKDIVAEALVDWLDKRGF